jgi:hypothetical protein
MPDMSEGYIIPNDEDYNNKINNEAARQIAKKAKIQKIIAYFNTATLRPNSNIKK